MLKQPKTPPTSSDEKAKPSHLDVQAIVEKLIKAATSAVSLMGNKGRRDARRKTKEIIDSVCFPEMHVETEACVLDNLNERLGLFHLSDMLPYRYYDAPTGIFDQGNTYGLLFECRPLVGAGQFHVDNICSLLQSKLPEGTSGQFLLVASPKINHIINEYVALRRNATPMLKEMAKKRAEYLKIAASGGLSEHEALVAREFRLYVSFSFEKKAISQEKVVRLKRAIYGNLASVFGRGGVKHLGPDGLITLTQELLYPTQDTEQPTQKYRRDITLNRQVPRENVLRFPDERKIAWSGSKLNTYGFSVKYETEDMFHLAEMQESIGSFFSAQNRLDCPFVQSFIFHIADQSERQGGLDVDLKNAEIRYKEHGHKNQDIANEFRELQNEYNQLKIKKIRVIDFHHQYTLFCPEEKYDTNREILKNIAAESKRGIEDNILMQLAFQLAHLPLCQSEALFEDLNKDSLIYRAKSIDCAHMLPVIGEMKTSNAPRQLILARRGQITGINPFDNKQGNYNGAVVGISGAGKSVFAVDMAAGVLGTGGKVIMVDVGDSFKRACKVLGGARVSFDWANPICLNFFDRPLKPETDTPFIEIAAQFVYKMANSQVCEYQKGVIKATINTLYREHAARGDILGMRELVEAFARHEDTRIQDLSVILSQFGKGGLYERLFNGKATMDFDNPFVVFELGEVESNPTIKSLVFYVLMSNIVEQMYMGDKKSNVMLMIDEAWSLMDTKDGSELVKNIYKRARKYNGSIVCMSQHFGDFQKEGTREAWGDAYYKYVLGQDPAAIKAAAEGALLEGLDDEFKLKALQSIKSEHGVYSELMVHAGNGAYAVGKLFLDDFSKALFSTQARDTAFYNDCISQGMSDIDAVNLMVERGYTGN